ncbi:MAG: virulence factor [Pseudomonadota bacterium]
MAKLITMFWRDIPAQVVGRQGRVSEKMLLSPRFHEAIDRAAMRAGKGTSDAYLAEWRRETTIVSGDIAAAVQAEAGRLEDTFTDQQLDAMARNQGHALDTSNASLGATKGVVR